MGRRKWRDVELSAYLDGELKPQVQHALEADLAEDPELRQRLAAMRHVATLVRAMPLREPPRNFLLAPQATRQEATNQRAGTHRAALAFRALAILMAVAFIASVSWQMLPRAATSQRQPMLAEAPSAQFAPKEEVVEEAPREAEIAVLPTEVTKQTEAQAEMVQAAAPVVPTPTGEAADNVGGMGGGGLPPTAESPTATPEISIAVEKAVVPTPTIEETEITGAEGDRQILTASGQDEQEPPQPLPPAAGVTDEAENVDLQAGQMAEEQSRDMWVPIILGAATAVSALLAYWFSRRGS